MRVGTAVPRVSRCASVSDGCAGQLPPRKPRSRPCTRAGRKIGQSFAEPDPRHEPEAERLPNAAAVHNRARWQHARAGVERFLREVPSKHRSAVAAAVVAPFDSGAVAGPPLGVMGIVEALNAEME